MPQSPSNLLSYTMNSSAVHSPSQVSPNMSPDARSAAVSPGISPNGTMKMSKNQAIKMIQRQSMQGGVAP